MLDLQIHFGLGHGKRPDEQMMIFAIDRATPCRRDRRGAAQPSKQKAIEPPERRRGSFDAHSAAARNGYAKPAICQSSIR
jgi:hypothetical protein